MKGTPQKLTKRMHSHYRSEMLFWPFATTALLRFVSILMANFYLLRHTSCPAVLTKNLFVDNPADCAFLLSPEGQQSLVELHVDGITTYLSSF